MTRYEVLQSLVPIFGDTLVVCNIGLPSQELHAIQDRPGNFYMLGTMGLASSIGLGLALAQPRQVVAIDGDGAVLTNLGSLATIANNPADNFLLLIIDNGSYGSTGDQPSYTGAKTSLAAVASGCGCAKVIECCAEETASTVSRALQAAELCVVVSKCRPGNAKVPIIDRDPVVIRDRFRAEVARLNRTDS